MRSRAHPWFRDPLPAYDDGGDAFEARLRIYGEGLAEKVLCCQFHPEGRILLFYATLLISGPGAYGVCSIDGL
jgi:hypothetical protein